MYIRTYIKELYCGIVIRQLSQVAVEVAYFDARLPGVGLQEHPLAFLRAMTTKDARRLVLALSRSTINNEPPF